MRIPIVLCIIGILLFGCEGKLGEEKIGEMAEKLLEKIDKPDFERVVLLSMKYNIEATKVENILDEYSSKHDFLYQLRKKIFKDKEEKHKQAEGKQNFQETIRELSIKYNVPREILASIIIDYKIWAECGLKKTLIRLIALK